MDSSCSNYGKACYLRGQDAYYELTQADLSNWAKALYRKDDRVTIDFLGIDILSQFYSGKRTKCKKKTSKKTPLIALKHDYLANLY